MWPVDWLRERDVGVAVVASGAVSMGMEILAGRIVAPALGMNIYTWGSIIGVFLAALALGYYRGGKRDTGRSGIARSLAFNVIYLALVVLSRNYVLGLGYSWLPFRFRSLIPVALLFGPPVYFLGAVTPQAVALSRSEGRAEASGTVFALGTLGSIIGAFGTTFVLIPLLSVEATAAVLGLVLVSVLLLIGRRVPAAVTAVVLLASAGLVAAGAAETEGLVYRTQTPYTSLEVMDSGSIRTLYLGGRVAQSAMDLSDPYRHVFDYTSYFHIPVLMTEPDTVLFIGGGGFTGPRIFDHLYNATVHVAEIDPVVVRVAGEYFDVTESKTLIVHTLGGRQLLSQDDTTYDIIVVDAFDGDSIPFQLTTREFAELALGRLEENGTLLFNMPSAPSGPASGLFRAQFATFSAVFPNVYAFSTADHDRTQNMEIVATRMEERLDAGDFGRLARDKDVGIDLTNQVSHYIADVDAGDAPVLRDDYAPVEFLFNPTTGTTYVTAPMG